MKLNCKPGDLAVIVDALPAGRFLIGRFCDVLQPAPDCGYGPSWEVRLHRPIVNPNTGTWGQVGWTADVFLRPIRDNDGEDETLQWVDVPRKQTA